MNLTSTEVHDSTAIPGVKFIVRRLNYISRCERDLGILANRSRLGSIMREMGTLCNGGSVERDDENRATNITKGKELEFRLLDTEYAMLHQTQIVPAYIRAGLVSVEGLEIDGKAADTAAILASAPNDFLDEVFSACHAASDLTDAQRKNSQSPGSSDAPEAGQPMPTIVESAAA